MRVLQIVKTSEGGDWAFVQAKWLVDHGIDIITILPDLNGKVAKMYIENNMKIDVCDVSLPVKQPWTFFKKKKNLREIIKKYNPDIIHFHFVTNIIFARLALHGINIPRVFQVPGPLHLENFFFRNLDFMTANKNDYYIPTCEFSRKIYLKRFKEDRVFFSRYGDYPFVDSGVRNKLRNEYNISQDTILIGMVAYFYKPKFYLGQFRGIKGHEDFIDAIKIVQSKHKNVLGVIIGGAWGSAKKYEEHVHKYAKKKNVNILFTGFRKDVVDIYYDLDIAVHPSHSENTGGSGESLSHAIPTIATNVGGFPDYVIDGKTGYLCNKKDPKDLAEKIEKMLEDPKKAKEMAIAGQQHVAGLRDVNNTANAVKECYESILKQGEKK